MLSLLGKDRRALKRAARPSPQSRSTRSTRFSLYSSATTSSSLHRIAIYLTIIALILLTQHLLSPPPPSPSSSSADSPLPWGWPTITVTPSPSSPLKKPFPFRRSSTSLPPPSKKTGLALLDLYSSTLTSVSSSTDWPLYSSSGGVDVSLAGEERGEGGGFVKVRD